MRLCVVCAREVKIIKILGEGGFSFVYLAQDEQSEVRTFRHFLYEISYLSHVYIFWSLKRQFALKKIRCPTGSEAVKEAMREVEAYRRFKYV